MHLNGVNWGLCVKTKLFQLYGQQCIYAASRLDVLCIQWRYSAYFGFLLHSDAQFEFQWAILTTSTGLNALTYCHLIGWFANCVSDWWVFLVNLSFTPLKAVKQDSSFCVTVIFFALQLSSCILDNREATFCAKRSVIKLHKTPNQTTGVF